MLKQLSLKLDGFVYQAACFLASREGKSLNDFIRQAVRGQCFRDLCCIEDEELKRLGIPLHGFPTAINQLGADDAMYQHRRPSRKREVRIDGMGFELPEESAARSAAKAGGE